MIKLNLGCGSNKLPGWVNIDSVKGFNPDLVHDLSDPLPYPDLTIDEVLAEDILEHFDKYARYFFCLEITRVLKIGGKLTLQVPNFKKFMWEFFRMGFDDFVDNLFGENMLGSKVYISHYGNHKWGYSKDSIKNFMGIFGIVPVEIKEKENNIRFTGKKEKHVIYDDLKDLQIYSYGNDHGVGEAALPLSFIKEKIDLFKKQSQ